MSKAEVIRCLKRYIAREVFSAFRAQPWKSHARLDIYRSIIFADQLGRTESLNINRRGGAKVYQPGVDVQRKCHPDGEVSRSR